MLEDKIITALSKDKRLPIWTVANILYDGCMNSPNKSNGARIANIHKVAEKSDKLYYHINRQGIQYVGLSY